MQVSGQGQMLVSVSCDVTHNVVPDVGVYVFPCLTLLGFDKQDPVVARLQGLGLPQPPVARPPLAPPAARPRLPLPLAALPAAAPTLCRRPSLRRS